MIKCVDYKGNDINCGDTVSLIRDDLPNQAVVTKLYQNNLISVTSDDVEIKLDARGTIWQP